MSFACWKCSTILPVKIANEAEQIFNRLEADATTRHYQGIVAERIGKMLELAGRNDVALASYERSFSHPRGSSLHGSVQHTHPSGSRESAGPEEHSFPIRNEADNKPEAAGRLFAGDDANAKRTGLRGLAGQLGSGSFLISRGPHQKRDRNQMIVRHQADDDALPGMALEDIRPARPVFESVPAPQFSFARAGA